MAAQQSTQPVRGFFTYPWHLTREPVEATLTTMRDTYLCNAIALAGSYHTATFLTPRGGDSYVSERRSATVMFHPNLDHYAPEGPWPLVDTELAESDILGQTSQACDALGMQLNLWLVVLHSTALGQAHPDLCVTNLVGDVYSHNLCPAHDRVRSYATGLVKDVCHQVRPHTLLLESATFMPALHGAHHEIVLHAVNPLVHWLLTLCFCPMCLRRAEAARVDGPAARAEARTLLNSLMEDEASGPSSPHMHDLSALVMERPRLRAYADSRVTTVMSLLGEMRAAAVKADCRVEVIPNTGVYPLGRSWTLGVNISGLGEVADGAMLLGYHPATADIEADVRAYRALAGALPYSMALNVGPKLIPNWQDLVHRAVLATRSGARGLFYYNWGLLTEQRLGWVRAANAAISEQT
jgi:hypothetical protein